MSANGRQKNIFPNCNSPMILSSSTQPAWRLAPLPEPISANLKSSKAIRALKSFFPRREPAQHSSTPSLHHGLNLARAQKETTRPLAPVASEPNRTNPDL
jgi:hypothetical protein